MAAVSSAALSRDIQTLFDDGTAVGLTDRQLLDRFAGRRDPAAEAAFEVLVRRHGPMVLRVCRNALIDPNDAQDALQATFLVLVRRCGSLRGLDSLGGWLYGVACRVSARARVEAARRRAVESRAAARVVEAVEPSDADDIDRDELGPIVQEEVRHLPEKYRAVVVLCYWEGLTQEQAAAQLGCPLGTVRSRLARARDLLRRRLRRRAVEHLVIRMDSIRRLSPLAPEPVQSTVRAAVQMASGQVTKQVASGAVLSLVHCMVWRTTMIKLGGIAAGVFLVGLAGYSAGFAAQRIGDVTATPHDCASDAGSSADAGTPIDERPAENLPAQGTARDKVERKAARPLRVLANVEGESRIIKMVPLGAAVKKGDTVYVLDSAPLQDRLVNQRIVVKAAEAAYLNAKLSREMAEIAVRAYRDGDYVEQFQEAEGNIHIANGELALAQEELKLAKNTGSSPVGIKRAELAVRRAELGLEKAQSRKQLLHQYTGPKKIKELEYSHKKAHTDELAKEVTFELERQKEIKLERQIVNCTLTAPIDGRLRYHSVLTPDGGFTAVTEGVTVREGQTLFSIEPVDRSTSPKD
jgi:RNA polymerase sigma factor (sigma-70 family)